MTAVGVLAVLVALAIPSFASIINSNRLSTAANELITSLQLARMEAVRRNAPVVVCASANAESADPTCTAGEWKQWISFIDTNGNGSRQSGETLLRASVIKTQVQMAPDSSIGGAIRFRSDGLAYVSTGALLAGTVEACIQTTKPAENVRSVRIRSGSVFTVIAGGPQPTCEDSP